MDKYTLEIPVDTVVLQQEVVTCHKKDIVLIDCQTLNSFDTIDVSQL